MNPKLKPLNHKQVNTTRNITPLVTKNVIGKPAQKIIKPAQNTIKPQTFTKKTSNTTSPFTNQQQPARQIKTPMKMQRTSTKKVQTYDCDDDFECELQDNHSNKYFENQLQKNIKQQALISTKKQPLNKALIVLPKLDSELKVKQVKDLQKQMDLEMSRCYEKEDDHGMY